MIEISNYFGEKPAAKWMKYYIKLIHLFTPKYTIVELNKEHYVREFNLHIKLIKGEYYLCDGLWRSKKTLDDYLSYLNQFSNIDNKIRINIYNDRILGDYNFINNMNIYKSRFKKLEFSDFLVKNGKGTYDYINYLMY